MGKDRSKKRKVEEVTDVSADQPIVKSSKKDKKKKKEAGQKFFPLSDVIEGSRKSKKQKKGVKEHFQVEEERPDKIGKSIKKIKKDKSKGKETEKGYVVVEAKKPCDSDSTSDEEDIAPPKTNHVERSSAKTSKPKAKISSDYIGFEKAIQQVQEKHVLVSDREHNCSGESGDSEDKEEVKASKPMKGKLSTKEENSSGSENEDDSDDSNDDCKNEDKGERLIAGTTESSDKEENADYSQSDSDEEMKEVPKLNGKGNDKSQIGQDGKDLSRDEEKEVSSRESSVSSSSEDEEAGMAASRKKGGKPSVPGKGGESASIFIGNLSWNVNEDALKGFFEENEINPVSVRVITNAEGRSKGYGYADFATTEEAQSALELTDSELDGRKIRIDISTPRGSGTPRGSRGGRGRKGRGNHGGTPYSGERGNFEEPSSTLFIGNLSFDATEESLVKFFKGCKEARIAKDRETGSSRGNPIEKLAGRVSCDAMTQILTICDSYRFGYIEYEDISTATAAQKKANGKEIMGRNIRVNFAKARDGGGQACGRGSGGSRGSGRGVIRGGYFRRGGRGGRAQGRGGAPNSARAANKGTIQEFKGSKISFDNDSD